MILDSFRLGVLSALKWTGTAQIARQLLQFSISISLARLLTPQDFGLIGIILIFTNFVQVLSDAGFASALVQKLDIGEDHLNSVFWMNILAGTVFTLTFILAAPLIAQFYRETELRQLTVIVALTFFVGSLGVVHRALLYKTMSFKRIAFLEITSVLGGGLAAISSALLGMGVVSLALQPLVFQSTQVILLWHLSSWRPSRGMSGKAIRELLGFSMSLTGFNTFNYWARNADNFLIGKMIGPYGLGIYSRAYGIMMLPVLQVTDCIAQVMFPALSSIQKDVEQIRKLYLGVVRIIALVTCPIMIGLLVVAKPFVLVIFGKEWVEAVPIFQILCLAGVLQGVGSTVGWIYTSLGRTDLMFKWGVFSGIIYIGSFLIGIHWGIKGVAIAYVLSNYFILWYPAWTIPGRLINVAFREMLSNIVGPCSCSIVMAVSIWLLLSQLPSFWPLPVILSVLIVCAIMIYILLIHVFGLRAYREIRVLLGSAVERHST